MATKTIDQLTASGGAIAGADKIIIQDESAGETKSATIAQLFGVRVGGGLYGVVGDGAADDTAAIQAAIDSAAGNVYFLPGIYRTTSPITLSSTNACSLLGAGRRYTEGLRSKFLFDHAGTGIYVYHQAGLGVQLECFELERSSNYTLQGTQVFFDGQRTTGGSGSYIVSNCGIKDCLFDGGDTGLKLRGAIQCSFDYLNFISETVAIEFLGSGIDYPASNVIIFRMPFVQVCGTALKMSGNAGRNITFEEADFESNTVLAVDIAAGTLVSNLVFDGIWLEDYAAAPLKLAGGDHIYFRRLRYASDVPLIDTATFGATNVHIDGNQGGAIAGTLGYANIDCYNFIANGQPNFPVSTENEAYAHGIRIAGTLTGGVIAGESQIDVFRQSGILSRNYVNNWNIASSTAWYKGSSGSEITITAETDPLGGSTAYSFDGFVQGADLFGVGGLDEVAGSTLEYVTWVKGKGSLLLGDNTAGRNCRYFCDVPYWQRVVMRTTRVASQQAGDGINITLDPDSSRSLMIWRPGIYARFNSIDSRPNGASGAFQGGNIDFTTYPFGAREGNSVVVYGSAAPSSGTWAIGDKVINSAPPSGGYLGWVCTSAGEPGDWNGYGTIA